MSTPPDLAALALPESAPIADFCARARQAEIELAEVIIDDATSYAAADEYLTEIKHEIKHWTEARQTAARPFKTVVDWIEGSVRPGLQALERVEKEVKARMAAFVFERATAERKAREEAQAALVAGDDDALAVKLTESLALAAPIADVGAKTRWEWRVKRINPDLVPDEYWIVDEARIAAELKAHKGEDAPVIPGVIPERIPLIAGKVK